MDRLVILGAPERSNPVRFFTSDEALSSSEKLKRLDVILGTLDLSDGSHAYWHNSAMLVIEQFINLEGEYRRAKKTSLLMSLVVKFRLVLRTPNFWASLEAIFRYSQTGRKAFRSLNEEMKVLLQDASLDYMPDGKVMDAFVEEGDLQQWQYRMQSGEPIVRLLADPEVAKVVDFDPFENTEDKSLDLREIMDSGMVALFQPSMKANSALAARAIKTKWYESVRSRHDMERPVGLVIDEFQKFVTVDSVSGDATFLDTARGYRCNAIFATQSVEALIHAMSSDKKAETAVAAILATTPSKFFFSTKDKNTTDTMLSLIPGSPIGGPHIIAARPPALLKPGQAYYSLTNGQWGRGCAVLEDLL
jgi:hypothetical protein